MTKPRDGFWFASVGGNPTEVVRIHAGQMFSTGCADAHPLDGVELIERIKRMDMPLPKAKRALQEAHFERMNAESAHLGVFRGYRRFP